MRSNKKVQNKRNNNKRNNIFDLSMRIKDDIFEDDFFKFNPFEEFRTFTNIFNPIEDKIEEVKEEETEEEIKDNVKPVEEVKGEKQIEEEKPIEEVKQVEDTKEEIKEEEINTNMEVEEEKPKEEKIVEEKPKNNLYYSKMYTYSYNNINGKEESYSSQSIKQKNNEHNISEIKENYKNSDGIYKTAYQRGLDDKITRFIKEKDNKTGKHNEKKIIKGLKENEINDFNKIYNEYYKKCGFKKYNPYKMNKISNNNLLRLLF